MSPKDTLCAGQNMVDKQQFAEWVRDALKLLYDSPYLENHPLVDILVSPEAMTSRRSQDLRRVLVAAIQALRPPKTSPPGSRDWRSYQILEQRFIAGLSPAEVQQQLSISRSLFFQEQAYALQNLVERLWAQRVTAAPRAGIDVTDATHTLDTEMLRFLGEAVWHPVDLNEVLAGLRSVMTALAATHAVEITFDVDAAVAIPAGNRVLLRQMLLAVIGDLVQQVAGGRALLATFKAAGEMGVRVAGRHREAAREDHDRLHMSRISIATMRQVLQAMGGQLHVVRDDASAWEINFVWPDAPGSHVLLLIDDHAELEDLFRRYLSGSPWRIVAARNGREARDVLARVRPTVIILDVILPQEDGWELLQAFKTAPETRDIPVIVCSVIHEPQLMASLGAAGHLPKPVTQTALYQVLRRWRAPDANPA